MDTRKSEIRVVRTIKLKLENRNLFNIIGYRLVPPMRRSLISFSKHDKLGHSYLLSDGLFQLMFESRVVETCCLNGSLYKLNLDDYVSFQTKSDENI